jgi:hypothetical protein
MGKRRNASQFGACEETVNKKQSLILYSNLKLAEATMGRGLGSSEELW